MLSEKLTAILEKYPYEPRAEKRVSYLPLGGIFWSDEYPTTSDREKLDDEATGQLMRLFAIRFKVWHGEQLSELETKLFTSAQRSLPNYGLFKRLQLNDEDWKLQKEVETEILQAFDELTDDASEVETYVDEHGNTSFSASFDLSAAPKKPWWKRLLRLR